MELGKVVITVNAKNTLNEYDIHEAFSRFRQHDWGDVDSEDWKSNDAALKNGERILASYKDRNGTKFWIISEWDRSATTILLPEDY